MKNVKFPYGIVPNINEIIFPGGHVPENINKPETVAEKKKRKDINTLLLKDFKQPVPAHWCHICLFYKPPRSHHCSRCGRCVAKMDHHCIFLGKCVGADNYKYFYKFLFHTVVGFVYCQIVIVIRYMSGNFPILSYESGCYIFLLATSGYAVKVIGTMLKYHTKILTSNKTQIEDMFDQPAVQERFSKGSRFANTQLSMGKYPITWLFGI